MGVPYLWVDSLCILQDDPEDLKRELACMPKIYKHSVVTFIASTSSSSHRGFLHVRDSNHHRKPQPIRLRYEDEHGERTSILLHDMSYKSPQEPINHRAWALQERLLSSRALIFGISMLAWNCATHIRHESALVPPQNQWMSRLLKYANQITTKNDLLNDARDCWEAILTQYSNRKLSIANDRLIAIAAVAEEFGVAKQWDFAAGLWRQEIERFSLWYYDAHIGNRRPKKYRAPSWSWASIDSENDIQFLGLPFLDIIDVVTEPATQELPYGNTKSGHMTVNGMAVSIHLKKGRKRKDCNTQEVLSLDELNEYFIFLDAPEDDMSGWGECVEWKDDFILLGSTSYRTFKEFPALLFKPVSITENTYQRIGILWSERDSEVFRLLERAEQKKLTIV